jgi:hypothetical protein
VVEDSEAVALAVAAVQADDNLRLPASCRIRYKPTQTI